MARAWTEVGGGGEEEEEEGRTTATPDRTEGSRLKEDQELVAREREGLLSSGESLDALKVEEGLGLGLGARLEGRGEELELELELAMVEKRRDVRKNRWGGGANETDRGTSRRKNDIVSMKEILVGVFSI